MSRDLPDTSIEAFTKAQQRARFKALRAAAFDCFYAHPDKSYSNEDIADFLYTKWRKSFFDDSDYLYDIRKVVSYLKCVKQWIYDTGSREESERTSNRIYILKLNPAWDLT